MSENPGPCHRRIDAAVKAQFLAALRSGERREDAAAAVGFHMMSLYGARRRDPAFAVEWVAALAASAAAERRPRADDERGEMRIASANRRVYQRRRRRNVRFDAARQSEFLVHLAASCDARGAAAAAGVCDSTVRLHRARNPEFADACALALDAGRKALEVEVVRQRLAAQARLRAVAETARLDPLRRHSAVCSHCGRADDADAEFDRIMRLLARADRKPRRVERGFKPGGLRHRWTFDEAIALVARKLDALGL